MTTGPMAAGEPAPLTPGQQAAVREARERLSTILRASGVAALTGWSVGVFGGLSVLWGLIAGFSGVVVGLALIGVAWNELRGRARLRALDPEGARILARNQVLLGVVIVVYCLWAIVRARVAPSPSIRQLEELAGVSSELVADITALVYGAVIVAVVAVQAVLARFHAARGPMLEAFRRETPDWVVELLGSGAARR